MSMSATGPPLHRSESQILRSLLENGVGKTFDLNAWSHLGCAQATATERLEVLLEQVRPDVAKLIVLEEFEVRPGFGRSLPKTRPEQFPLESADIKTTAAAAEAAGGGGGGRGARRRLESNTNDHMSSAGRGGGGGRWRPLILNTRVRRICGRRTLTAQLPLLPSPPSPDRGRPRQSWTAWFTARSTSTTSWHFSINTATPARLAAAAGGRAAGGRAGARSGT